MAKTAKSTARQRAEQARRERERAARRARRVRTAWWAIAAAPAFVVLLLLIKLAIPEPGGDSGPGGSNLSAATLAALSPAASTLDSVGRGQGVTFPKRADGQPPLTSGDKPQVLYIGGEFCPFCAGQRWGLVIALNRFGSFTGLSATRSASDDSFPNTATLSFHGATYVSEFLAFDGVETSDRERRPLETLTPEQQRVLSTYDAPPWVDARSAGAVPFVDFGNRFLQTGAAFMPDILAGLSHDQIADQITNNPSGPVAQAILGSANAFTAILCALTNGQPAAVCTSPAATAYQQEVS